MPHTPRSERATTRNPETAPPRIATWTASTRLRCAADAVRTFALTLMYMPMMPDAIEHRAPTKKANAVMSPMGRPAIDGTSATSGVSTHAMMAPMTTAPTSASRKIVVYWRRMKATAPSRIVPATSCMAWVPTSRRRTSRARYSAKSTATIPAIGMIRLMELPTAGRTSLGVQPLERAVSLGLEPGGLGSRARPTFGPDRGWARVRRERGPQQVARV